MKNRRDFSEDDPLDMTRLLGKREHFTATKAELAWSAVGLLILLVIALAH